MFPCMRQLDKQSDDFKPLGERIPSQAEIDAARKELEQAKQAESMTHEFEKLKHEIMESVAKKPAGTSPVQKYMNDETQKCYVKQSVPPDIVYIHVNIRHFGRAVLSGVLKSVSEGVYVNTDIRSTYSFVYVSGADATAKWTKSDVIDYLIKNDIIIARAYIVELVQ